MPFHSIREIFKVGYGPSSSHTMGPANACDYILNKYKNIKEVTVTLFDSLALTGKGHLTDYIIDLKLKDVKHNIVFDTKHHHNHPNTMTFHLVLDDDKKIEENIVSIGGGSIVTKDNVDKLDQEDIYQESFYHHLKQDERSLC